MTATTYEVFQGKDGWRYREVADNGRKLTVSEAYSTKSNALRAVRRAVTRAKSAVVKVAR